MSKYARIHTVTSALEDFDLDEGREPTMCPHAGQFFAWADALCQEALHTNTPVALNQAKVLLVDRYFSWRDNVPKRHQALATATGHICLFGVFEASYRQLHEAWLQLAPPPLTAPPLRVVEPRHRYDGLVIGELCDDDEFS